MNFFSDQDAAELIMTVVAHQSISQDALVGYLSEAAKAVVKTDRILAGLPEQAPAREEGATQLPSPRLIKVNDLLGYREMIEVSVLPGKSMFVRLPKDFDRSLLEGPIWKHILPLCANFHLSASRFDAPAADDADQSVSK